MYINLNGKKAELPQEVRTIQHLLHHYQLENRIVVVELNKEIVDKEQYESVMLNERDTVEIVHFVGGG
ncbi:sulfur carrier protein ThiS [Bacillus massiliigorillae]|uniref:sulfur carrier protein ThiS n=1 Tax=Bacillus massiliigorillae TaxID=1243664 RepID=UPI00039C57B5|nr:sulfur carrier protein ThiS [Bacillus massiliigorillae]